MDENLGAIDTIDISRVVSEEDTTKGSECAHQVGFPGDWSLDATDIVGDLEFCYHLERIR